MKYSISQVEDFLRDNGFVATALTHDIYKYRKGEIELTVPRKQELTQAEIDTLISEAQLQKEDFNFSLQK